MVCLQRFATQIGHRIDGLTWWPLPILPGHLKTCRQGFGVEHLTQAVTEKWLFAACAVSRNEVTVLAAGFLAGVDVRSRVRNLSANT